MQWFEERKRNNEKFDYWDLILMLAFNPFVPNTYFLYPLKTSENHKVWACIWL